MNLADKRINPVSDWDYHEAPEYSGITYKEALVLALAGNGKVCQVVTDKAWGYEIEALNIIRQADAIIKQMEKNENG